MYKKIGIFLDAFLRSEKEQSILLENIIQLKKLNLPILLVSNSKNINQKIIKEVDYFFYDSNDLKFDKNYENYEILTHFKDFQYFRLSFSRPYIQRYGLSVMSNFYKSCSILSSLGFDAMIRFEWDIFFHEDDLVNIGKTIFEFKNKRLGKAYIPCQPATNPYGRGPFVEGLMWIVETKFFLENYPKITCEDDYDNFLIEKLKDRTFLTDSRFLYKTLIENNLKEKIVETDPDICKITKSRMSITSPSNYPKPCTNTTIKYLFKKFNEENKYILFSYNFAYVNPSDPNWEIINYKIKTQKSIFEFTHKVNTENYVYQELNFDADDFPIKIFTDDDYVIFNSKEEIEGTFIAH